VAECDAADANAGVWRIETRDMRSGTGETRAPDRASNGSSGVRLAF
jgi:hypothetical protein